MCQTVQCALGGGGTSHLSKPSSPAMMNAEFVYQANPAFIMFMRQKSRFSFQGEADYQQTYKAMKEELAEFIDRETTVEEEMAFYDYFTNKYR